MVQAAVWGAVPATVRLMEQQVAFDVIVHAPLKYSGLNNICLPLR